MKKTITIDSIDALLPQTQCGLCDYAGCRPYANAIINDNAPIDRCPPGGTTTLQALAKLLDKDATPYLTAMEEKAKADSIAVIREAECIGCTKCIQVCPTDAIIGSSKQMHTVITDACTGCELCVPACPVDCIDILPITEKRDKADEWRKRHQQRNARLKRLEQEKSQQHLVAKYTHEPVTHRKAAIAAAIQRAKTKKSQ